MKILRIILALVFWTGITLLFFIPDLGAVTGFIPKLQFIPALMATNFAVIAALVLLTLLFGRIYCSVICPLGVFQDGLARIGAFIRRKTGRKAYNYRKGIKWLRYGIWVMFVCALAAGIQLIVSMLDPYSTWGRILGLRFSLPAFIIPAAALVLVSALSITLGRAYCNDICPVGTTLGLLSRFALLRPVIDRQKCRNCKACEHACKASCINIAEHKIDLSRCVDCFNCMESCKFGALKYGFAPRKKDAAEDKAPADPGRRAFVAGAALALGSTAAKAAELPGEGEERSVPLTPPGSSGVKDFYRRCTACQLCITACPNEVLRPSLKAERLMQPEMSFEKGFCRPECTLCSSLCPSGAIRKISREEKTGYHVGTARIDRELCLASQGTHCGNCARNCPTGAMKMVRPEDGGRMIPVVNEELCTGCGACEYLCPVHAASVEGKKIHIGQ